MYGTQFILTQETPVEFSLLLSLPPNRIWNTFQNNFLVHHSVEVRSFNILAVKDGYLTYLKSTELHRVRVDHKIRELLGDVLAKVACLCCVTGVF